MIRTAEGVQAGREPAQIRLPERLGPNGTMVLAAADVAAGVVVVLVGASVGGARCCTLAVTLAIAVSFFLGRYRFTFASQPRDEIYSVATAAVVAGVLLALLAGPFAVSWFGAYAALLVWSIVAACAACVLTEKRRGDEPTIAKVQRVPPAALRRLRRPFLRAAMNVLDFVLAIPASLVLLPVMGACALAVFLGDGGPVLFTQERAGIDGRPFTMFKFRTMRLDADGSWARPSDERITRVGRFLRQTSLDELPQLWNVLRGEMSLVGPRPEMTDYAARFLGAIPAYSERLVIKPGITGWAQIQYERNFQPDAAPEVMQYDLLYVANYSMSLYLYCLAKTACEVFAHRAV